MQVNSGVSRLVPEDSSRATRQHNFQIYFVFNSVPYYFSVVPINPAYPERMTFDLRAPEHGLRLSLNSV